MHPTTVFQPAGTLILDDIIRFQYFHANRRLWPLTIFMMLFGVFSFTGLVVTLSAGSVERFANPGLFYVAFLVWAALFLVVPYLGARRQFAKQQYLREPMQFCFTADRVRLEGPHFTSELNWSLVQRIHETKNLLFIYQSPQIAWILPKRFFGGEPGLIEQWKEFVIGRLQHPGLFQGLKFPGSFI
jgi:hypothetical protein